MFIILFKLLCIYCIFTPHKYYSLENLIFLFYILLKYHAERHTDFLHRLTEFSVRTHLGRKEWWKKLSAKLDAPGDYSAINLFEESNYESIDARFQNMNPENFKEIDRKKILDYMKMKVRILSFLLHHKF